MPDNAEENYLNIKPFRYIYNSEYFTFSMCKLDYRRNFIHLQENSGYKYIKCPDRECMLELCMHFIVSSPSTDVAIFVIKLNGDIDIYTRDDSLEDDEIEHVCLEPKIGLNKDFYALGDFAEGLHLKCYGLLTEVEHGIYKIIER